jgi:hypothetical protein
MRAIAIAAAALALVGCGGNGHPRHPVDSVTVYQLTTATGLLSSAASAESPAADRAAADARARLTQLRPRDAVLRRSRDQLVGAIGQLLATARGTAARRSAAATARAVVVRVERSLERHLGRNPARLVPD